MYFIYYVIILFFTHMHCAPKVSYAVVTNSLIKACMHQTSYKGTSSYSIAVKEQQFFKLLH